MNKDPRPGGLECRLPAVDCLGEAVLPLGPVIPLLHRHSEHPPHPLTPPASPEHCGDLAPGLASSLLSLAFRTSCRGSKPWPLLPWSLFRSTRMDVGVGQVEPMSQRLYWHLAALAGPHPPRTSAPVQKRGTGEPTSWGFVRIQGDNEHRRGPAFRKGPPPVFPLVLIPPPSFSPPPVSLSEFLTDYLVFLLIQDNFLHSKGTAGGVGTLGSNPASVSNSCVTLSKPLCLSRSSFHTRKKERGLNRML